MTCSRPERDWLDVKTAPKVDSLAWPTERVQVLTDMWAQGYSAALIAEKFSTTRSAIIGKVTRLNLPKRDTKIAKRPCAVRSSVVDAMERRAQTSAALMDTFVEIAARTHGVSEGEIKGKSRVTHVVAARWHAVKLGRAAGVSKMQIARYLGQKHSTVMHACKKMGVA